MGSVRLQQSQGTKQGNFLKVLLKGWHCHTGVCSGPCEQRIHDTQQENMWVGVGA